MDNSDLYDYTSGRWLYNEKIRLSERRLHFDVNALGQAVADCLGRSSSEIQSISKLAEGGFNRVFELSLTGGLKVLARLPYRSTQPNRFAVASEVATLNLLRQYDIPVPKVLHYSTDPENHVGAEYIVLEKLNGRPLGERWFNLSETERLKIISQVVKIEAKLMQIELPACGSIYHSHDLPGGTAQTAIATPDANGSFCIGPMVALRWWHDRRASLPVHRGPFFMPIDLLTSSANKELAWLRAFGRPRHPFERAYREGVGYKKSSPDEHVDSLEKFIQIAPHLIPHDLKLHKPMLRHPDLQPNNIFVTDDLDIVGLIDWQHSVILPRFLAAGIPDYFANYRDEESLRFVPPKMPSNFNHLDHEEQSEALEVYRRRHLHFFYLGLTSHFNPVHFEVLSRRTDLLTRKTFQHASQPWEGNNVPLKSDLIHLTQIWQKLVEENGGQTDGTTACPIAFTEAETTETLSLLGEQEDADTELETVRNMIGVNADGWTSTTQFGDALDRARVVKEQALQNLDTQEEKEMALQHWLFDDFDEDE